MRIVRPFIFIASMILIFGLACSMVQQTAPSVAPQTEEPVQPLPTEEAAPREEASPTEALVTSAGPYFTEEFESDPQWYYKLFQADEKSDPEKATYSFDSSHMIFDIQDPNLYMYYIYEGDSYEKVRLDIKVENRGVNTQQVGLICQFSDDGWYEWVVQSDGRWELYAVSDGYHRMHNGASNYIKQGKDVNEYSMSCVGKEISFFVNGEEPKGSPYIDRKYAFRDGKIGFSISSLRATPVLIEVDWLQVSEPQ